MFKKICSWLFLFVVSLLGTELTTFEEITASLKRGEDVRVVIDFDDCSMQPSKSSLSVYTQAQAVMLRPNYLQFANTPLTTNHPAFPKTPVLENTTYKISDNGEVSITIRLITCPIIR